MQILLIIVLFFAQLCSAQTPGIKISKATKQKTYVGAGPVIHHNYIIVLKKTTKSELSVDAITAIADGSVLDFVMVANKQSATAMDNKKIAASNKAAHKISFGYSEQSETDRRGRPQPENEDKIDLSKGVKISYTFDGKSYEVEIKNFTELSPIKGK
jgi:hypothetical protein